MIAVDFSPEELGLLEDEARRVGKSPVELVRAAVLQLLEDYEDARDLKKAREDLAAGRETTVSADTLLNRYAVGR